MTDHVFPYRPHRLGAAIALALAGPAGAGVISVDGTTCTLVEAITAANTDGATGGCPAGSGDDTLELTAAVYTLTAADNFAFDRFGTGLPVVTSVITVDGDPNRDGVGAVIERSPVADAPNFRLLAVRGGNLTLRRVTLRNGAPALLPPFAAVFGDGGAIVSQSGTVTLIDCTVTGNRGRIGGGISHNGGRLTLTRSTVSKNGATSSGGGIHVENSAIVAIANSTISGNSAKDGGGVSINGTYAGMPEGSVTLNNSTITGNTAVEGGGLSLESASLYCTYDGYSYSCGEEMSGARVTLTNSTVSGNTASEAGGGLSIRSEAHADLTHSTLSGNDAPDGGGIAFVPSESRYAPFMGVGTLTLTNSLIANSRTGDDCRNIRPPRITGSVSFVGVNLIEDGSCDVAASGGLAVDPKLRSLLDNGGPSRTHASLSDSPVVDAAADAYCSAKDQRGVRRPQHGHCDIGAFERVVAAPAPIRPIRDFFDQAASQGELVGTGNGAALKSDRRTAGRSQILAVGDYHAQGLKAKSCNQTKQLLRRIDVDGTPDTDDYVTGKATAGLAQLIEDLRDQLDCE